MSTDTTKLTVLRPENMTIYEAMDLRELFSEALGAHKNIEVNLSEVAEIDCAGLQLMVSLKNDAMKLNKSMSFTEHSREVIDFLDLLNISQFFGDPVMLGK